MSLTYHDLLLFQREIKRFESRPNEYYESIKETEQYGFVSLMQLIQITETFGVKFPEIEEIE